MADQEQIVFDIDPRSVMGAIRQMNTAVEGFEKGGVGANERVQKAAERMADMLLKVSDRSRNSMERLTQSIEKQAAAYSKTGVERMVSERDRLIKKLGDEQGMIERVTAAYAKMIDAENGKSGGSFQAMGRNIESFVRDPLNASKDAASGLAEKLGPMGGMLAAGAAALTAFAVAGWEAAKSLGEYGVQIRDVELRTGMSAKEVGQFSYAARAVGQEVGIFERMMRGLSQAMDENSADGEKARAMLARLHVTLYDATTGGVKPTAQALQDIGAALATLPAGVERDAAAMALFKRAGIEAIPVMVELGANLKTAKEKGYGPSDEEIERYLRYQRTVTQIATDWAAAVRWMKEAIVPSFDNGPDKVAPATSWIGRARNWMLGAKADGTVGKPTGFLGFGREYPSAPTPFVGPVAPAPTALTSAQRALIDAALSSDTQTGAMRAAQKELEKTQTELKNLQEIGAPWGKVGPLAAQAEQQKAAIEGMKKAAEEAKHYTEQLKDWQGKADSFAKKGDEAELDAISKIYYERDLILKQGEKMVGQEAKLAAVRKSADEQASVAFKKDWEKFEEYEQKEHRSLAPLGMPSESQIKKWGEEYTAQERIASINLQSRVDTLNRNASHAARMVDLSGTTGMDAIRATYQIRIDLAKELAGVEAERILRETNGSEQMIQGATALKVLNKEISEAQEEAAMKQLELQKQQMDSLKKESEGLWHTLLTNPRNFGQQLGSTVHEAVIKPVAEGMAGLTANVLKPIIYGQDGAGGLAGMFKGVFGGGHADPMKLSTDMNTAVTAQNSAALATLTAILAGAMGMAAPAIAMPAGIGGLSLPAISAPAVSGVPVGGGASADLYNMPTIMRGAGGGFNPLSVFGGGTHAGAAAPMGAGGTAGNWAGMLKNFRSINWGGLTHSQTHVMDDQGFATGETQQGGITGVNGAAGAALFTGGSMLAQQGLLGSSRGTWGGVGMGAAGGAMIGMQMGGPLGAAIGAGAGALAGIGEKIAGVETPENEAKRLIKQIYGLTIDNNTARQIAAMAKQSYGGAVSVAVRSSEVRQLLQLYAESTGQKSNLFLNDPHGVNLVQAGGRLNQSAVYNNGTPYTYASNLPVMGPAGSTIPTGNPYAGGATYLTLNLNGQSAADVLEGRVGPALASNSRMVASSWVDGGMASSSRLNGAIMMLSPNVAAL